MSRSEQYEDLAMRIINDLVSEDPSAIKIRPRDLTRSVIPYKRSTKKSHRPHPWRGEDQTKNVIRAIYQTAEQAARGGAVEMTKPEWNGVELTPTTDTQRINKA